jgi:hypothetical protein
MLIIEYLDRSCLCHLSREVQDMTVYGCIDNGGG